MPFVYTVGWAALTLAMPISGHMAAQDAPRPLCPQGLVIRVTPQQVRLHADRGPGLYDGDQPVDIAVASAHPRWSVWCDPEPLEGVRGAIPGSRVYVSDRTTAHTPDVGGGATYVRMVERRLVARGFRQPLTVANTLHFRVRTVPSDPPGHYRGHYQLTACVAP